jgi:hypothetical protein
LTLSLEPEGAGIVMTFGAIQRMANRIGLVCDGGSTHFTISPREGGKALPGLDRLSRTELEFEVRKRYIDHCAKAGEIPDLEQFK